MRRWWRLLLRLYPPAFRERFGSEMLTTMEQAWRRRRTTGARAAFFMPQRFGATPLGVFAIVALAVSAVGIYGVVAYGVSQRQAELGIRIALGARRRDIVRTVAFRSGVAVAAGMVVGVAASMVATRAVERFLFGITMLDPASLVIATALLSVAAAAACWSPVRRAVGADPLTAIRSE